MYSIPIKIEEIGKCLLTNCITRRKIGTDPDRFKDVVEQTEPDYCYHCDWLLEESILIQMGKVK